jgi:hypothetical protein
MVKNLAPYILSKSAGTLFVQLLANQISQAELQVVTMHPGFVFGDGQKELGITEDMFPFDQGESQSARKDRVLMEGQPNYPARLRFGLHPKRLPFCMAGSYGHRGMWKSWLVGM